MGVVAGEVMSGHIPTMELLSDHTLTLVEPALVGVEDVGYG